MKPEEIRKLSSEEIVAKLSDSRRLMKFRFQQVSGQLTDTSRPPHVAISRLETILKGTPGRCTGR